MSFLYRINQESVANSIPCKEGEILEKEIEDLLQKNSELVLGEKILYIGRQLKTAAGKILDLLAIDQLGRLIVIELKRGYAPRDIVAQVIDYSSWLSKLSEREIENLAKNYFDKNNSSYRNLHDAFTNYFGREPGIRLGEKIINVLFAQEFQPNLIDEMEYLRKQGLGIECIRFDLFGISEDEKFLLVHKMFTDEEDTNISTETVQRVPSTQEHINKHIISQLSDILADRYIDWASSLGDSIKHTFKMYKSRDGSIICSYIKWNYGDGILGLSCGFYIKESHQKEDLYVSIWVEKKSDSLANRFLNPSLRLTLVNQLGYLDELEDKQPAYTKYIAINVLNIDTISKVAIEEIDLIKPLIEKILAK